MSVHPDTFCNGKRIFLSMSEAAQAARKTSARSDMRCHAYRCTACGKYHYGNAFNKPHSYDRRELRSDGED
jgi:hypothetical protein